jgi:hypothetical protein
MSALASFERFGEEDLVFILVTDEYDNHQQVLKWGTNFQVLEDIYL